MRHAQETPLSFDSRVDSTPQGKARVRRHDQPTVPNTTGGEQWTGSRSHHECRHLWFRCTPFHKWSMTLRMVCSELVRGRAPSQRSGQGHTRILLGGVLFVANGHQFRRDGNPTEQVPDHGNVGSRVAPDTIETKSLSTHSREQSGCSVQL